MAILLSNQTEKTRHYHKSQQVKYLHLEAEVDMLLQKINNLMQRRQLKNSTLKSSTSD